MTVLIVDDSRIIVNKITQLLKEDQSITDIKSCDNFEEATKILNLFIPDLIILDIQLKESNGLDVLKFVKETFPSIKVVVFSNYTDIKYKTYCYKLGAEYFFDKSRDFSLIPLIISSF